MTAPTRQEIDSAVIEKTIQAMQSMAACKARRALSLLTNAIAAAKDDQDGKVPCVELACKLKLYSSDGEVYVIDDMRTTVRHVAAETDNEFERVTIDPNQPELWDDETKPTPTA